MSKREFPTSRTGGRNQPNSQPPKRRRANNDGPTGQINAGAGGTIEAITNVRQIRAIISDFSDVQSLQKGFNSFRGFIQSCLPAREGETDKNLVAQNTAILREFLEVESKESQTSEELDDFPNLLQAWSFASQSGNQYLLSGVISTLALLLRATSINPALNSYGKPLCNAFIQPSNLKVIYRCVTTHQGRVASPTLRLLTEINNFDSGSLVGLLHASFDFTIKDLGRHLEVKRADANATAEDPNRPTVRTVYVRWILSFFQHGSSSVKGNILGQRSLISPLFKHIRTDSPKLISDVLNILRTQVVMDTAIPRLTKTSVFNEWILGNISSLYTRTEPIREAGDLTQTVALVAHEFLSTICTRVNGGVYFQDSGWYPPGTGMDDGKKRGTKVYNRTLASFILGLKPFADSLQQDLLLAILKAAPELVADYFNSTTMFSFEPKLTATWIGYCTLLTSIIELRVPENFGLPINPEHPPSVPVAIESICPKALTKGALSKCLTHENQLIKFLSTRMLVSSFNKLRAVLSHFDAFSSALTDPSRWTMARTELLEEFSRRVPEINNVISAYNSAPVRKEGGLLKEAASKLLMGYYVLLPEVTSGKRFDVNVALGTFFSTEERQGMALLEMEHLLRIAKEAPDVKWWSKPASSQLSFFTSTLKLYIDGPTNNSFQQVKAVVQSVVAPTHLFQSETLVSPLDALLVSLGASSGATDHLLSIFGFLDECLTRCVRAPLKYIDDFSELLLETHSKQAGVTSEKIEVPSLSPIFMAIAEQWRFLMENNKESEAAKADIARWLGLFMKLCVLIGENILVMKELCERMSEASHQAKAVNSVFKELKVDFTVMRGNTELPSLPVSLSTATMYKVITEGEPARLELLPVELTVILDRATRILSSQDAAEKLAPELQIVINGLEAMIDSVIRFQPSLVDVAKSMIEQSIPKMAKAVDPKRGDLHFPFVEAFTGVIEDLFIGKDNVKPMRDLHKWIEVLVFMVSFGSFTQISAERKKKFILKLEPALHHLLSTTKLLNATDNFIISRGVDLMDRVAFDTFLALVVDVVTARKVVFDIDVLPILLRTEGVSEDSLNALARYISSSVDESLDMELLSPVISPNDSPALVALNCAQIRKSASIKTKLLERFEGSTDVLCCYILAFLDISSTGSLEKLKWKPEAEKEQLQELVVGILADLTKEKLSVPLLELFSKAVYLFPTMDMCKLLGNVLRSKPTPDAISLVKLLISRGGAKKGLEGMKDWLLRIADHLTRRFVEDKVLREETKSITARTADLLKVAQMSMIEMVPRASINAILEAIFDRKIESPEAVELGAVILSKASSKSLDFTKLLQIILGKAMSPLATRMMGEDLEEIHYNLAFAINRLFKLSPTSQSNITTLEGALLLYRGTCSIVDKALLDTIMHIEGYLAMSCVSRIATWSLVEDWEGVPLITRSKGRLIVTLDGRAFARSNLNFPTFHTLAQNLDEFGPYISAKDTEHKRLSKVYDWYFIIPSLTYCLVSPSKILKVQSLVENNCVGFGIMGLCSPEKHVRRIALSFLEVVTAKLEESSYWEKVQVQHLLCALLASLEEVSSEEEAPIPTVVGVFLAQAVNVLTDPGHIVYAKVMEMLLRRPLLDLWDIPRLLSALGSEEEYYKEVNWKLNILGAGMRQTEDLALYGKRKIFETCLSLYQSPYAGDKTKAKITDLLWNAADVEGGGTTLITRHGVVIWALQQLTSGVLPGSIGKVAEKEENKVPLLKRTIARLDVTADRGHVREWSRGHIVGELDGIYGFA